MKIGLISDTHNSLTAAEAALTFFKKNSVSEVIHVGDWTTPDSFRLLEELAQQLNLPLSGVLGNNDQELKTICEEVVDYATWTTLPEGDVLEKQWLDLQACIYHGQDKIITKALLESQRYDVLIKGHSHHIEFDTFGKTVIINPGSIAFSIPRK